MKKILGCWSWSPCWVGLGTGNGTCAATADQPSRFVEVKRGRLEATVGSTGTLQPREVVDVGAQVVGPHHLSSARTRTPNPGSWTGARRWKGRSLDTDGKIVKLGTVLAQIDPALYEAQRNSAAWRRVKAAQADVLVKTATLYQATRDWGRAEKLFGTGGVAQAEYDQYKAAFEAAKANLELSKANVGLAEANLKTAQTNLDYTTISARSTAWSSTAASTSARPWWPACRPPACSSSPRT